jgi:hypothetical protein
MEEADSDSHTRLLCKIAKPSWVSVIRLTDILLYHTLLRQLEFEFQINEILFSLLNEFSK